MKYIRTKGLLLALATVVAVLGFANTSANAKVAWSNSTDMKWVRTAPKSIQGNWYGYINTFDKHANKLSIHQKYLVVPIGSKKSVNHKVPFAKNQNTAYKKKNMPNIQLLKHPRGWYFFALNAKDSWIPSASAFTYGMIQPVKYGHSTALAYYPGINDSKSKVQLLTKTKHKHPVYMSTKHLTIVNLAGGK